MKNSLEMVLGLAIVLGWAATALTADPQPSNQGSGSSPSATLPGVDLTSPSCCNDHGVIDHDCAEGCGCCGCCSGVIVGGEWHILRPVINDDPGLTVNTNTGQTLTPDPTSATVIQNFQYRFKSDPSIWIGYRTECGLGVTATWFHLNNSAGTETATAINTVNGTTFTNVSVVTPLFSITPVTFVNTPPIAVTVNDDIKMDIWDFDVTQCVEICHFDLIFGGGIRYLHISQDYSASATVPTFFGIPAGVVNGSASNSFNAGGPTLVLDGKRRFGCSGFGFYANARGGVLFGTSHQNSTVTATPAIAGPLGLAAPNITSSSDNEATVGFGEIELGVEWTRRVGSVCPFARLGFEGREYWGIGNAVNVGTGSNSSAVGAFGLALSAGIGW
jgi:hypothetical protein